MAITDDPNDAIRARLTTLENIVNSIVKNHEGNTRDELKDRLDVLEKKLHDHFVSKDVRLK